MVYPTATRLCFTRFVSTTSACPLMLPVHHWVGPACTTSRGGGRAIRKSETGMDSEGHEPHDEWSVCGRGEERTRVPPGLGYPRCTMAADTTCAALSGSAFSRYPCGHCLLLPMSVRIIAATEFGIGHV